MEDQLIETGEFKVDKEYMHKKLRENRKKIYKHRAGLIYRELLKGPLMLLFILAVLVSVVSLVLVILGPRGLLISFVVSYITYAWWMLIGRDSVNKINDSWNPLDK